MRVKARARAERHGRNPGKRSQAFRQVFGLERGSRSDENRYDWDPFGQPCLELFAHKIAGIVQQAGAKFSGHPAIAEKRHNYLRVGYLRSEKVIEAEAVRHRVNVPQHIPWKSRVQTVTNPSDNLPIRSPLV